MPDEQKSPERSLILSVFTEDPAGKAIFDWLVKRFYNTTSFTDDPYRTAFNEGQRYVIQVIIDEMWKKQDDELIKEFTNE